jgi:hypothetical protein
LLQIENGLYNKHYLKHATIVNNKPTYFCHGQNTSYTRHHREESKGGHHGNTVVGVEVERIIGELCTQELIKGGTLLHIVPFCEGPNKKSEGFAKEKQKT